MFLDVILIIAIVFALIKGFRRGLIVGVFSFIALLIGLAAAIKLSALVAGWLGDNVKISVQWLPVISFALVFLVVVLLVRLGANIIERTVELGMMGWLNRIGGMALYTAIILIVFSVLLFYATELDLIMPATQEKSLTYHWVAPWGPRVVGGFGEVLPFFKDMFSELSSFFGAVADKMEPTVGT